MKCFEANIPVVCGTTGWLSRFDEVLAYCNKNRKSFFYASNYSMGVNIFFEINRQLARLMNRYSDYNVSVEEIHHVHKLDAPSGTAITLAKDIIEELERKKQWNLGDEKNQEAISIHAIRDDEVQGTHCVSYDSSIDNIEIKHTAKSRKGFAFGAVMAAEFIQNKIGYYSMNNLMSAT
jgi:4-hydroxy-tetrahydrodipicolinate reductase